MPRLPVDGRKVIEHRITFGTLERELLRDATTSYRLQSLKIPETLNFLDDPLRLIQVLYSVAIILEVLGIESGLPTPVDAANWFRERDVTGEKIRDSGNKSILQTLTEFFTGSGDFEGTWPGGY